MVTIGPMAADDVPAVYELMRQLAAFENYLDDFVVREQDVRQFGLGEDRRFTCYVAKMTGADEPIGYAVMFEEPWNYQMAPTFVLKEFYVAASHRSGGVGAALFDFIEKDLREQGAVRLRWLVIADNQPASAFYSTRGGQASTTWNIWELPGLAKATG
ncbi:MAG: GNAT family N-acetyltransferase [Parvularculaceae bacterium]|nr:GNAT family N-acetyltransferase [Parvularculaceae bacterium]